jgi:hypothetical protein
VQKIKQTRAMWQIINKELGSNPKREEGKEKDVGHGKGLI